MKKSLLLIAGVSMVSASMQGQVLSAGYVTWPESSELPTYIQQWNGGKGNIQVNGKVWEDENFFISRVKPKARFVNTATQVDQSLALWTKDNKNGTEKRLVWWVPISDASRDGVTTNAMVNAVFDQEVFSTWSYVDHYGNWSAPYGWVPGVFADVAHKNGVAVSGVAGVPYGGISSTWSTSLTAMGKLSGETVGKFLYYHGVDGLGYNSEWSSAQSLVTNLVKMHDGLKTYMADKNPIHENMWYGGTSDRGSIQFDTSVLSNFNSLFGSTSIFHNYNWHNRLGSAATDAATFSNQNRNPYLVYAGMNMQGNEPASGNINLLKGSPMSLGWWGAHQVNMLWQDRNAKGSSGEAKQRTYINYIEQWFTNGKRNPAMSNPATAIPRMRPSSTTAGMSSLMSARSTLSWAIKDEPFISFFNLGNGKFFNYKGERMHSHEWYNIGIQDYMPTWRWWFAPTFLGRNVAENSVHMAADFVWDDAYMGGSCLQLEGTTTEEYLHLFKTNFTLSTNNIITVRYRVLDGEGDVDVVFSTNYDPSHCVTLADLGATATPSFLNLVEVSTSEDLIAESEAAGPERWITKKFRVLAKHISGLKKNVAGNTKAADPQIAVLGLRFKNTKNLKMLLGEMSVMAGNTSEAYVSYGAVQAPVVTLSKTFANNFKGVDGKIIWNMEKAGTEAGAPLYNFEDFKVAGFRVWAQQDGQEPVMTGMTTSWADIVYQAPYDATVGGKIRFGVSAISANYDEESSVSWGQWIDVPAYVTNEEIQLDKATIKPNEEFELSFMDAGHPAATWRIIDVNSGAVLAEGTGTSLKCDGLPEAGFYHVDVESNGNTHRYTRFVAISSTAVGALPEIHSLTVDGAPAEGIDEVKIELTDTKKLGYTGRYADGVLSRGIDLDEKWFGVKNQQLQIKPYQSFSMCAWIRYDEFPDDRANFVTVENRATGGWPADNWGFFWSRITKDGKFVHSNIDTAWGMRVGKHSDTEGERLFYRYDDAKIDLKNWTHIAIVFEYSGTKVRQKFYINGEQQLISAWVAIRKEFAEGPLTGDWTKLEKIFNIATDYGTNTKDPGFTESINSLTVNDWIAFGGSSHEITATKGCVDDFQVWGKAMTDQEVKDAMNGLDKKNLPADVYGFWDFEGDPASDNGFVGYTGANASNKSPKAYYYSKTESPASADDYWTFNRANYMTGCPFVGGESYPIVTTPKWSARTVSFEGSGNGEAGEATATFSRLGDYNVELTLENGHGKDVKTYPVIRVVEDGMAAIGDIEADGGVKTYTVDKVLFVEFDADGAYTVEVYNAAGVLAGQKELNAVAGQSASIGLGAQGVYLVKVTRDGEELRTVKVLNK